MKFNFFSIISFLLLVSCSDFLDIKPDQTMAVPKTLEHCELLLNDYSTMNTGYPSLGITSADDHYLDVNNWESISDADEQSAYIWAGETMTDFRQWQNPYKTVFISNQILTILKAIDRSTNVSLYDKVGGSAHFYRAFAFHQLTGIYTMPYDKSTAAVELGIPLRMSPNLDEPSSRSSLLATYTQIILDYKLAVQYLPSSEVLKGRPDKAAAYAGLARLYLDMQEYEKAYNYADSCLALKPVLIDYATINSNSYMPIERFNVEVLFPATCIFTPSLGQYSARISDDLYHMYSTSDLRKTIFFQPSDENPNIYVFKGSYDNSDAQPFVGLTSSEVYLIRAESAVRTGRVDQALSSINTLLQNRIAPGSFVPIKDIDSESLLRLILDERRKELVFRGQRWSDLRRLNQDTRFVKVLVRQIGNQIYRLEPNSSKYAHLIPDIVISESGIPQNKR